MSKSAPVMKRDVVLGPHPDAMKPKDAVLGPHPDVIAENGSAAAKPEKTKRSKSEPVKA